MDYSKIVSWKTKEESRAMMQQAAEFKVGDVIIVCRNRKFHYWNDDKNRIMYSDAFLAGGEFRVLGMTNHRGTWSGTWKYKIRTDILKNKYSWKSNSICYVDFGIASLPGRCSECKHRLTRLMGPGACPGYFEPVEEEDQSNLNKDGS